MSYHRNSFFLTPSPRSARDSQSPLSSQASSTGIPLSQSSSTSISNDLYSLYHLSIEGIEDFFNIAPVQPRANRAQRPAIHFANCLPLAVHPLNSRIYFCNVLNNSIHIFSDTCLSLDVWEYSTTRSIRRLSGIAFTHLGQLVVIDQIKNSIIFLTDNGIPSGVVIPVNQPIGIAVHLDRIYIIGTDGISIFKISTVNSTWSLLKVFKPDGLMNSLAVNNAGVFACFNDTSEGGYLSAVHHFDLDGRFFGLLGHSMSHNRLFHPVAVALHKKRYLLVLDILSEPENSYIRVFDTDVTRIPDDDDDDDVEMAQADFRGSIPVESESIDLDVLPNCAVVTSRRNNGRNGVGMVTVDEFLHLYNNDLRYLVLDA